MIFDGPGKPAAQKDCAAWIDLEQRVSAFGQVDGLDEPSVQAAGPADMGVEIGQALDLDQTSSHDAAFCQAPRLPSMTGAILRATCHTVPVRDVVILGSTGSIGTQALEVVADHPDQFRVVGLAAGGSHMALLARQALDSAARTVAVSRATTVQDLQLALYAEASRRGWAQGDVRLPRIVAGPDAAAKVAAMPCDVVLNGITGSTGLAATLAALRAGRILALANKESLVVGGPLVTQAAQPGQIVAVDSEHSALAQCLRGGAAAEVDRLILTASGGPFRGLTREQMSDVTPEQALAHPTWKMGRVITTNSATLVNKGLELLEAHLLYGVDLDRIDVVVHPQSIVHSMVQFVDGSSLAQCSPPDMKLPIALGLSWPDRLSGVARPCDWSTASSWTFEPLDNAAFPAVELARQAGRLGGSAPAVYNAANEVCVDAFHEGRIGFSQILDIVAMVLREHAGSDPDVGSRLVASDQLTLERVLAADAWARALAKDLTQTAEHTH
jgi:1-deoxy-D-xylulose-5-phosphate reductoisomerase